MATFAIRYIVIGSALTLAYNVKKQQEENERNRNIIYQHPCTITMMHLEKQLTEKINKLEKQNLIMKHRDELSPYTYNKYFNRCSSQLIGITDLKNITCGSAKDEHDTTLEHICNAYAKQHYINDTDPEFTECTIGAFYLAMSK